jgi:hypothetical protein
MLRWLFAASIAVFLIVCAHAQLATTTALVGTVTDTSGQTVPRAKVTAVNRDTASCVPSLRQRNWRSLLARCMNRGWASLIGSVKYD